MLDELTDAIARSLRERVGAGRATERATEPATRVDVSPAADVGHTAWYVYGVVAAEDAGGRRGPHGRRSRSPRHRPGRRCARRGGQPRTSGGVRRDDAARRILSDMAWVEATARAHEHTLEELRRRATVIPMRMCSVYRTEDGVEEMLRREQRALDRRTRSTAPERASGASRCSPTLRGSPAGQSDKPARRAVAAIEAASGAGTAYLARRREERDAAERVEQLLEEAARQIHERLRADAADGRVLPPRQSEPGAPEMILNGVYLVVDDGRGGVPRASPRAAATPSDPLGVELERRALAGLQLRSGNDRSRLVSAADRALRLAGGQRVARPPGHIARPARPPAGGRRGRSAVRSRLPRPTSTSSSSISRCCSPRSTRRGR